MGVVGWAQIDARPHTCPWIVPANVMSYEGDGEWGCPTLGSWMYM